MGEGEEEKESKQEQELNKEVNKEPMGVQRTESNDEAVNIIRGETEGCVCPQGFQLTQSIGGGTGSYEWHFIIINIQR